MLDLRSDTGTVPTASMRIAMKNAVVGDDGRVLANGKSEDPTVAELEALSAKVSGKEDALFCNSGTMANIVTILSTVKRGEYVALDKNSHIFLSETAIFSEELFGRKAMFIKTDAYGIPSISNLIKLFTYHDIKLLCLENSMGFYGGTCVTTSKIKEICAVAEEFNVPVHIDGARIFNAATYLNTSVKNLVRSADTAMFCLSKGLGAPIGSMICGSKEFISQARSMRKAIGGNMRQAGVVAAAGIVALNTKNHLKKDHENAKLLVTLLNQNTMISIDSTFIQSNMIKIDISASGVTSQEFEIELKRRGLLIKQVDSESIRLVFHKDIKTIQVKRVAHILNSYCKVLKNRKT